MRWSIGIPILLVLIPLGAAAQQNAGGCVKGTSWSYGGGHGGQASATVLGMTSFKGARYCHARTTSTENDGTTTMDYYFADSGHDVWMVITTPDGSHQQLHLGPGGLGQMMTGAAEAAAGQAAHKAANQAEGAAVNAASNAAANAARSAIGGMAGKLGMGGLFGHHHHKKKRPKPAKVPQPASQSSASDASPAAPASSSGSDEWCKAGSAWNMSSSGGAQGAGSFQAKVDGLTQFKGGTYCKASYSMTQGSQSSTYTYYFTQSGKDVWMVLTMPDGSTQQMHVLGGGQ